MSNISSRFVQLNRRAGDVQDRILNASEDSAKKLLVLEQYLSTATQLLRGWLWETDAEHRITFMSDSVAEFAGKPPAWHYGKTRQELGNYTSSDPDSRLLADQLAARKPLGPLEFRREQDGSTIWMRTMGLPRFGSDGRFLARIMHHARANIVWLWRKGLRSRSKSVSRRCAAFSHRAPQP